MKHSYLLPIVVGLFLVSFKLHAEEAPLYEGDVQQWEKSMLAYVSNWQNVADRSRKDFYAMRVELNKLTSLYPDRPRLWLILSSLYICELGLIVDELKGKGLSNEEGRRDPEYLETIEKINENFRKVIKLNKGDLSLNELDLINTTVTESSIKVGNYRNMLRLWGLGERYEENDNADPVIDFEYKAYSKIVTAYVDEKRYDEALAVIDEMNREFPAMKSEIQAGREAIQNRQKAHIEKALEQGKNSQLKAKFDQAAKSGQKDEVSKVELEETPKSKEVEPKEAVPLEAGSQIFYWGFGILILLIVRTTLMRRR